MSALAPLAAEIVEWDKLGEVAVNALVAGVGVPAVFAVALFGATRALDARREGRAVAASLFGATAIVFFLAVIAALAFGIQVMVSK